MPAFVVAAVIAILDQLSKFLVTSLLAEGGGAPIIPNVLHLTIVHNTGAAFGVFQYRAAVFAFVSIVVIFMVILMLIRHRSRYSTVRWGLAFVLGGAVGNLIDRLRFGYVVDFIDIRIWPVFNLADSFISIGAFLLVWYVLFQAGKQS